MPRSATGHRHRRWSLRHPGQPHQPPRSWPYDQSCTNIQPGPPSGGRPLLVAVIHAANIQDRDGLALVCRRLRRRLPWLRLIFADGGYQGETAACAAAQERLRLQIVKREPGSHGFAVLPKRWLVERTFARFSRNRRLAKDFEATLASAATMVHLASIQLLV